MLKKVRKISWIHPFIFCQVRGGEFLESHPHCEFT